MSVSRDELLSFVNEFLKIDEYQDYCPNGLQIEGKESISKISFAVSATQDSINKTVAKGSDCLIVHHGILWHNLGARAITGVFGKRVIPLVKNDINLIGYHLPLDGHLEVGHAVAIAKKLDLVDRMPFGEYKKASIGVKGNFKTPVKASELRSCLNKILNHEIIMASPNSDGVINNIGIVTGGGGTLLHDAANEKLDAYLTGEMSEHQWNDAIELGVHMFAGGHQATETLGLFGLMEIIKNRFSVSCEFISSDNPV